MRELLRAVVLVTLGGFCTTHVTRCIWVFISATSQGPTVQFANTQLSQYQSGVMHVRGDGTVPAKRILLQYYVQLWVTSERKLRITRSGSPHQAFIHGFNTASKFRRTYFRSVFCLVQLVSVSSRASSALAEEHGLGSTALVVRQNRSLTYDMAL